MSATIKVNSTASACGGAAPKARKLVGKEALFRAPGIPGNGVFELWLFGTAAQWKKDQKKREAKTLNDGMGENGL